MNFKTHISPRILSLINYSIPTYISSFLALIFFPVIAIKLGVVNLGKYELYLTLITGLSFLLKFGWSSAYARFLKENHYIKITSTLFISRIVVYFTSILFIFLLKNNIKNIFELQESSNLYFFLILFIFISTDIIQFFQIYFRFNNHSEKYAYLQIVDLISLYFLYSILFITNTITAQNLLITKAISSFTTLTYANIILPNFLNIRFFKWSIFKECYKFGYPLIIAAIGLFALKYTDKIMLRTLIGSTSLAFAAIGYYAFSERITTTFNILSTGFRMAWMPYVLNTYKKKEAVNFYKNIFNSYLFGLSSMLLIICLICFYLIPIFFNEYSSSLKLIPIIASSVMIYSIGDYFPIGLDIKKKSKYRAYASITSISLNLILNFILIKPYGFLGAGVASYFAIIIFSAIQLYYSNKLFKVPYDFYFLITCAFLGPLQSILFSLLNINYLLMINTIIFLGLFYYARIDLKSIYSFLRNSN